MIRLLQSFAAVAALVLTATPAHAQATRDQLILGHWECTVSGGERQYQRITADFDSASTMAIKFYSVMNTNGNVISMSLNLTGGWSFDPATSVISQNITGARIDEMVVNGQPMTRAQHPRGEAGIAASEAQFVAEYGRSPFAVTALDERSLTLTDGAGASLNCVR